MNKIGLFGWLIGLITVLGLTKVGGQTAQTYAPIPPLDCRYSIPICNSGLQLIQNRSMNFSGPGRVPNEFDENTVCIKTPEADGFWYDFNVTAAGDLVFFIEPRSNPDLDFDWILFRSASGSCAELVPVLCNYASDVSDGGLTGTEPSAVASGDQDINGAATVRSVRLLAGSRYFLYIKAKTPFPQEYTLSFQGTTASFGRGMADPRLRVVGNTLFNCGERSIFLEFDRPIARLTANANDFQLISPSGQTISFASIANPSNDGSSNEYNLELRTAIPLTETGNYTVRVTGDIADVCNRQVVKEDLTFSVDRLTLPADAGENQIICAGETDSLQLRVRVPGFENLPGLTYQWTPEAGLSNPRSAAPRVLVTQTTVYTVTVRAGDCSSPPDTVRITVSDPNTARIEGRTAICRGERITLTGIGAERFRWVELNRVETQISDVPSTNPTVYTVIPFTGNCEGNPIRFSVNLFERPDASFTAPDTVCVGDRFTVEYDRPVIDRAFRRFVFDSTAFIVSGFGLGPYQLFFTEPGLRFIRLEASANGCVNTTVRRVFVRSKPVLDMGEKVFLCSDQGKELPINLEGSGGCRFSWSPVAGLSNPNVLRPFALPARTTTYTLRVNCPCEVISDTVQVFLNPVVSVNPIRSLVTYCQGSAGATLRTRVEGGSGIYDFRWQPTEGLDNPFAQNPNATPASVTTYTVFVTDNQGCRAEPAVITVRPQTMPFADAGPDKLICFDGDGVDLVAQGFGDIPNDATYTYKWSPPDGLSAPDGQVTYARPTQTTIYTLVVTNNSTGCSSVLRPVDERATVTVEVLKKPIADAGPDKTICYQGRTLIGDIPWDLDSTYSYFWSPPVGLNDVRARRPLAGPVVSTTYYLTVVSVNCRSVVDSVRVNVISAPRPYARINYIDLCPDDSVQLFASSGILTSDSSLAVFEWFPPDGLSNPNIPNPKASPGQTTVYTVSVLFRDCSSGIDTVRVNKVVLPQVIADNNFRERFIICKGDTFTIPAKYSGIEPFSVEWIPNETVLDTFSRQPRVRPSETTRYFVRLTKSGCSTLDSVDIKVVPAINPVITADRDTICEGDSVILTVRGGLPVTKFTWEPALYTDSIGGRSVEYRPPFTQNISVIAQDAGCIQRATFKVVVIPQPKTAFDFNIEQACNDYRVHFIDKSDSAVFHMWDYGDGSPVFNGTNPTHVYTQPGTYTVRMRGMFQFPCEKTAVANRTFTLYPRYQPQIQALPNDTVMLPFTEVTFIDSFARPAERGIANRLWTIGDESYRQGNPITYRFLRAGRYPVILAVTDSGGCITRDTVFITVLEPTMRIPNVFTPNEDGSNDGWNAGYNGQETYSVSVFDRWGNLVFQSVNQNEFWNGKMNNTGDNCAEGSYFFQMKIGPKIYRGDITLLR